MNPFPIVTSAARSRPLPANVWLIVLLSCLAAPLPALAQTRIGAVADGPRAEAEVEVEVEALSTAPSAVESSGYVARKDGLRNFFSALSARLGKPVIVSQQASRKQISGDFDMRRPQALLEKIAGELGLIWYHDGQTVYVYEAAEMRNALITLPDTTLGALNGFLRKAGLYDRRYPLRGGSGVFYAAGPPIYIDLVQKAAAFLQQRQSHGELPGRLRIEVVRLENTFVADRNMQVREHQVTVPGMATVIEHLLRGERMAVEMQVLDRASGASDMPGAGPIDAGSATPGAATTAAGGASLLAALAAIPPMPPMPGATGSAIGPSPATVHRMAVMPTGTTDIADKIRVIAYRDTNSLLIKGTREQVDFVKRLVERLDIAKRHVELSLWIIDLEKSDFDQLGVSWSGGVNLGSKVGATFNNAVSTLDGRGFVASIMAMQKGEKSRVVSRPVILTQENVPALFDNNHTFYTKLEGERVASLEKVTFGTMISVLPRFAENGQIEMSLTIEDGNELGTDGTGKGETLPRVSRMHISTIARVPKGMSLLIGGYTNDRNNDVVEKIPFLGDLPGIGALFRTTVRKESNLVRVFLIQPREIEDAARPDASDLVDGLLSDVQRDAQQQSVRDFMDRKNGD